MHLVDYFRKRYDISLASHQQCDRSVRIPGLYPYTPECVLACTINFVMCCRNHSLTLRRLISHFRRVHVQWERLIRLRMRICARKRTRMSVFRLSPPSCAWEVAEYDQSYTAHSRLECSCNQCTPNFSLGKSRLDRWWCNLLLVRTSLRVVLVPDCPLYLSKLFLGAFPLFTLRALPGLIPSLACIESCSALKSDSPHQWQKSLAALGTKVKAKLPTDHVPIMLGESPVY